MFIKTFALAPKKPTEDEYTSELKKYSEAFSNKFERIFDLKGKGEFDTFIDRYS